MDSNDDQVWFEIEIWNRTRDALVYQDAGLYYDPVMIIAELQNAIAAVKAMIESTT